MASTSSPTDHHHTNSSLSIHTPNSSIHKLSTTSILRNQTSTAPKNPTSPKTPHSNNLEDTDPDDTLPLSKKPPRTSKNDPDDDLNEFSSSLSISTLSTASSSGGDKSALQMDTNNPTSTSSRKREHNRRKSSEPLSVKKLPRLLESEDEDMPHSHNHEEEEDYDLLDEDDDNDFTFDLRTNDTSRKASVLYGSNNSLKEDDGRCRDYGLPSGSGEEKLINSSNEEYETSIRQCSEDSEYHIRWKNHQSHLLLAFESLLEKETFCDVTLICDHQPPPDSNDDGDGDKEPGLLKLRAHKIVLSACSEYFQRILSENPCKHPVIVLKDYEGWEIQALLHFMYRGEVEVTMGRLATLLNSAQSLQIRGLTDSLAKLGPDLFKANQPFISQPTSNNNNNNINNNNNDKNTKAHLPTPKSYAHDSSGLKSKGSLSVDRVPTGVLNLSMDLSVSNRCEVVVDGSRSSVSLMKDGIKRRNANNMRGKPQNLSIADTSIVGIGKDKWSGGGSGLNAPTTNHHHHLNHHNTLAEDHGQTGSNDDDTPDIHPHFHNLGARQNLLPRRKQARPRRRSGDYIAQDLRKVMSSLGGPHSHPNFHLLNAVNVGDEEGKVEHRLSTQPPDSQYGLEGLEGQDGDPHNPLHPDHVDEDNEQVCRMNRDEAVLTRLALRRRSSRRHINDQLYSPLPINVRNDKRESEYNNVEGGRMICDEEEDEVLDYTTTSPGNKKLKITGITQGLHLQPHLPFGHNWSPTLGTNPTTPPAHIRTHPLKHEGDSDDGISSTADQCPSPPLSPTMDPKQFLARHINNHTSPHDFPLFGLHPDHPHSFHRSNLVGSLHFNKQSPPSPSNFFLGPLGSMSITPIGAGDREDSRAGTPSTPPNVFSPAGFPLQLPLQLTSGNSHGGHHNHHHGKEERDGERSSRGGSGKQQEGTRGSPVGWPGLPLGPPPIFGRHRAQHSAPRGGPPRAWSNADLTEALHNVWNKKMTTSQASRIFGIPYNSLLMYVRGKYGKSLKLDLLKKGLDLAMENSQNSAANNTTTTTTSPPANSSSSSTPNNSNTNNANSTSNPSTTTPTSLGISITSTTGNTTTATTSNNNNNNNTSSSTPKGHSNSNNLLSSGGSEHNNNNAGSLGHLHHHLQNLQNHHQQQQQQQHHHHHHKSSKSHDRGGLEMSHELPPGFNPFTAASIFGEYPSPFPFASALSHILPQANLVNQHGLGHPGLGLSLNHSGRNDKVSVGDDDK